MIDRSNINVDELRNEGMYVFNKKDPSKYCTFLITGLSRSGTTMVAKTLYQLGVNVGHNLEPEGIYEDKECWVPLEQNKIEEFKEVVKERNESNDIWGWKRPNSQTYITNYTNLLRNPKFIVLFRDPLAISIREKLSAFEPGSDFKKTLENALNRISLLCDFISASEIETLALSYEKCLFNKEIFVNGLINFLNINTSKEQIENAINSIENGNEAYLRNSKVIEKRNSTNIVK